MKDFASVGRRLRKFRIVACLVAAVGILLTVSGVAAYWDHGPPSRYVQGELPYGHSHYEAIPSNDPEYLSVLHERESRLMYMLLWGSGFLAVGALIYAAARKAPAKEVLHLAQARKGVLTLPEVSTGLDIDPQLAAKALAQLQKLKIAVPRWQDIRRNIWEFPDYMELPPSPELAHDGTLPIERSMAPSPSRQAAPALALESEAGPQQAAPATPAVMMVAE